MLLKSNPQRHTCINEHLDTMECVLLNCMCINIGSGGESLGTFHQPAMQSELKQMKSLTDCSNHFVAKQTLRECREAL